MFRDILRIGLPAGIQGSMYSIANFVIQGAVNSFGAAVITGSAACSSLEGFLFCPVDACQQACTTSVSQNLGARKIERTSLAAGQCMALVALIAGAGAAAIYLLRMPLLRLYTADAAALDSAVVRLRIICWFYIVNGMMAVSSGAVRGLGHSALPALVTFLGCCALRIVWIYTFYAAAPSITRLFAVYPVSWVVTTAVHCVCYVVVRRKMRRTAEAAAG
jgi:Na+-driven multidrug efflux pump